MTASSSHRRRPAGLVVERLEDRTTPDATFHKLFVTEHTDLAFDHTGANWEVSSELGTIDYDPASTLHYVPPAGRVNRPAGSQWDFIGTGAGQPIYLLPQLQDASLLYLGASSEETPPGTFDSYTETDPRVPTGGPFPWLTVRLAAVRGPGHFSVWQSNQFGGTTVWMSSFANGIDATDKLLLLEGAHAHYNWAFTAPGVYEIDLRASAVLASTGQVSQSEVATFHFTVDDALKVTSVTPTASGFLARFNRPIDPSALNLYDVAGGTLGPADVTLVGTAGGPVRGSLVVPTASIPNPSTGNPERAKALNAVEFVRTGGPLAADTYAVTLRGETTAFASNRGFKTTPTPATAGVLDGNGDGTTGDSYIGSFTVTANAVRLVSLPDFVRGFGQAVNVPANGAGIPVTIDNADGVTRLTFDVEYDPALLSITAASRGGNVPATFSVTLDASVAGRARVTVDGPTALPAGSLVLVNLTAAVPATAPYADKHVLRLVNLLINSGGIAGRVDHGVHVAALVGDTTGNRGYSGLDAANVLRLVNGLDAGFTAYRNADPVLIADASGNGAVSALDATLIARKLVGAVVPAIPDPPGSGNPPAGGPDPRLFIPTTLTGVAGGTVTVPVRLEVTEPGGVSFRSADFAVAFDPARFSASNVRVGGLLSGFVVVSEVDNAAGVVRVSVYSPTGVTLPNGTTGDALLIDFAVSLSAPAGGSPVNLLADNGLTRTALNEGQLTLSPAPTNAANDANVDGTITVGGVTAVSGFRVNDGSAQRSRVTSLRVTFSTAVPGLTAANFVLTGFAGTVTVTPNGANTEYTLTFGGAGTENGSLADGLYTLTVTGVPGLTGTAAFSFHRLFGDADGDRDVDARDFTLFRQALFTGVNIAAFDWDADGDVDLRDFARFRGQYGKRI
jgi:surface-anchored protein